MKHSFSTDLFEAVPLIGIMRGISPLAVQRIAALYLDAGLTTLEITMNSEAALSTLEKLSEKYGSKLNIGAGTVLDLEELNLAIAAGAQFIVTPVFNEAVVRRCVEQKIPVFPGAYTPTEIYRAWEAGADMVKVFPASGLGADYIRNVKAPMRFLKLLPTGGISLENCLDFFRAGASGLALGSNLFRPDMIRDENWKELKNLFQQFRKKAEEFRNS